MQFMRKLIVAFALALCSVYVWSCTSEQAPQPQTVSKCDTSNITSARIYAIVQQNCTNRSCHPGGGAPGVADFGTLPKLKTYITNNGGAFHARVTGPNADMPEFMGFPALPRAVRDSIACWIEKGMPD